MEVIKFGAKDGVILDGILNICKEKTNKILIQIHGMTSNCFNNREKVISETVANIGIDTICFNNRGSEVIRYAKKIVDGEDQSFLAGTAYENIEESYFDIVGAIEFAMSLGYKEIYLQGHSLGSTKVVYTYNKLKEENNAILNNIKAIILLSLVDIPGTVEFEADTSFIDLALEKERQGKEMELMPFESYINPMSVKTFLRYTKYNEDIDFARYGALDDDFEILNKIQVPLFMRWGNDNELIKQDAKDLVEFVNSKINNQNKDIGYIEGANHSYSGYEEELAEQIKSFFKREKKFNEK